GKAQPRPEQWALRYTQHVLRVAKARQISAAQLVEFGVGCRCLCPFHPWRGMERIETALLRDQLQRRIETTVPVDDRRKVVGLLLRRQLRITRQRNSYE